MRFSTITDSEIDDIEQFVRNDLKEILELNVEQKLTNNELTTFFGIYAACPQKFSFLGYKKTIKQMVNYVSDKLNTKPMQQIRKSSEFSQPNLHNEHNALEYFCPNQQSCERKSSQKWNSSN